ncbi:MAG: rod shape-determining protein MreC [Thiotrichales bacterium]
MKQALFLRGPSPFLRLIVLVALSITLIFYDQRSQHSDTLRAALNNLLYPLKQIINLPVRAGQWSSETLGERKYLIEHNRHLAEENRALLARLQQLDALKIENARLRELLNAAHRTGDTFTSARLLAVSMNPSRQKVIVDRGSRHGMLVGTPLIDEFGLMGQITRVFAFHSEAMLISDPEHATPVQVLRNGVRSIAMGVGRLDALSLLYVPINADIVVGDTLVTSGLGGRFPADYPVAEVTYVDRSDSSSFATVTAAPRAHLDRSREVLLLNARLEPTESGETVQTDVAPSAAPASEP